MAFTFTESFANHSEKLFWRNEFKILVKNLHCAGSLQIALHQGKIFFFKFNKFNLPIYQICPEWVPRYSDRVIHGGQRDILDSLDTIVDES